MFKPNDNLVTFYKKSEKNPVLDNTGCPHTFHEKNIGLQDNSATKYRTFWLHYRTSQTEFLLYSFTLLTILTNRNTCFLFRKLYSLVQNASTLYCRVACPDGSSGLFFLHCSHTFQWFRHPKMSSDRPENKIL